MPFARINNLNVYYKWAHQDKPETLVFINSLGTDLRIWDTVADAMSAHANVLRYDKRGHGLSEETPATDTAASPGTTDLFAHDLIGLLDHLGIERCTLVGLSIGGRIAMTVAHKQPQRVKKLLLSGTAHIIGTAESWNKRIRAVQTVGLVHVSGLIMDRWFSPHFRETSSALVSAHQRMVVACAPADYNRCCESLRDDDLTDIARHIQHPTRCLVGSEDMSTPPNLVRGLAELIPGADLHILEGSGHIPCVDNPGRLIQEITEFM